MAEKEFRVPVFRRAIRGYAPEHVDAFIAAVQEKYYSLIAENEKLRVRISEMAAENKKRGVEDEMRRHEIEEIREEAERLIGEAKERADRLLSEAEAEAKRVRDDASRTREDADIYAEEAKSEALEMLKERDAMLSRAAQTVSALREKLAEEYGNALSALDGFEAASAETKEEPAPVCETAEEKEEPEITAFEPEIAEPEPEIAEPEPEIAEPEPEITEPEPEITEIEQEIAEPEPEEAEGYAGDEGSEEVRESEEGSDDIEIPDFSPVFEEDGEEDGEGSPFGRDGFPFAFDEDDHYPEDSEGTYEEDGPAEVDERDGEDEETDFYEEETEPKDGSAEEDAGYSDVVPDYLSEYTDGGQSGVLEEENDESPEEEYEEESEESEKPEESEGPEEPEEPEETEELEESEETGEPEESEETGEPEEPEETEESEGPEETDFETSEFDSASSETYRDYDLDEILRGLEYMTNEKTEQTVGSTAGLPDDDADIVDALKKKFGDVPGEDLTGGGEEDAPGASDFYEDEEHEDGESFDPNSFLRFRK